MQWCPGIYITGGLGGHGSGGFNDLWISEVLHVKPLGKLEKKQMKECDMQEFTHVYHF